MQTKRQESWFVVNRKESKVKNLTQEERIISWSRGASNISSVSLKKMGFLSQQISRDELKPGDHIYSWRNAYIYAHHGIYVGNGEVIHFTCGGGLGTRTGTSVDNIIVSSVPNHGGDNPCPNCRDQSNLDGVISSCLDCFLAGGNLYLFEYGVSGPIFMAKPRGAICTTAVSDSSDETVHRARYLLSKKNGFGAYDLSKNNCIDFAIYCKTGLIVWSKLGSSGQANSWSAARGVFSLWGTVKSVSVGSAARLVVSGVAGIGVMAMAGYGNYCYGRLCADIGVRSDTSKVPVEDLVMLIAIIERRDDKKSS
ncbi:unnamed protein product [Brassica oleracea var. botrytis]|uniref:LRAT domain-containing protein n=1 Tax=Brassica carinata TaxID=52824 RepID=A0A8X7WRG5_BRACI|nr:hypothetical protein Bca52824_004990 [Brassica carinata]